MANIVVGSFTPSNNPSNMPIVRPEKGAAVEKTYTGVGYFSWPATVVGKTLDLTWDFMLVSEFNSLDALYVADNVVVYNPNDGSGKTYNVNLLSLDAEYFLGVDDNLYKNIKLQLLIMSQV